MRASKIGKIAELAPVLLLLAMPYAKLVLEVAENPHLADDVLVKRVVGRLEELDDEARDCSASSDMNVMNEKTFKRTYSEQQSR